MPTTVNEPSAQVYTLAEAGKMAVALAEEKISQKNSGQILSYGFPCFETLGLNMTPGGLSVFHAMSGEGKSTLVKGITRKVLEQLRSAPLDKNGKRRVVFYAHTEESSEVIWAQLQCNQAVTPLRLNSGNVDVKDVRQLAAKAASDPIFLIGNADMASTTNPADSAGYGALTVRKIFSAIWKCMKDHDVVPAMLVVDHLHDLSVEGHEHSDEQTLVTLADRELVNAIRSLGSCHTILVGQDNAKQIVSKLDGMDRFPKREDMRYTNNTVFKAGLVCGVFSPTNGHVLAGEPIDFIDIRRAGVNLPHVTDDMFLIEFQKGRYANCKVNGRRALFTARANAHLPNSVWGDVDEISTSKMRPSQTKINLRA